MKKILKIMLSIIILLIILMFIDLICIFTINKPILAIKENEYTYKGLFYNTYNCSEFSIPQIKSKTTKFTCSNIKFKEVINIVDKTKEIKDFACREALEQFYEDELYEYYYNCIKSEYIKVIYSDNSEEKVRDALNKGIITIKDLDKYNINYIRLEKN